jgi:hypothetical protein
VAGGRHSLIRRRTATVLGVAREATRLEAPADVDGARAGHTDEADAKALRAGLPEVADQNATQRFRVGVALVDDDDDLSRESPIDLARRERERGSIAVHLVAAPRWTCTTTCSRSYTRAVSPPGKLAPASTEITGLHAPIGVGLDGPRRAPLVA